MKVAVVGSRNFSRLDKVHRFVMELDDRTVVVSGGARGVDRAAEQAANRRGLETMIFPADWKKLGRSAGYIRNAEIVAHADLVVAFWDGVSKGTRHVIQAARKKGIPVQIVGDE